MLTTEISVWLQVIASGIFLVIYALRTRWWQTIPQQVLLVFTACLFSLTLYLTLTSTNEGLSSTPIAILIPRLGFAAAAIYGTIAIELDR